jgi:hypothetical protein
MAISVIQVLANQTIPPSLGISSIHIYTGIVECAFKGDHPGPDGVTRDTLSFLVGRVNLESSTNTPVASCVMSPASFAYDGTVTDALWAVDRTDVTEFVNLDRGSGTADLQVVANLSIRGANGIILRVNYMLFYPQ